MAKVLYAVIQPPAQTEGNMLDAAYPFVALYHRIMYPNICGYSLANKIFFHDTLEDAKEYVFPSCGIRGNVDGFYKFNSQDAVIKLEVENDKVISITRIYEIEEFKDAVFHNEQVKQAVWKESHLDVILDESILNVINEQLQLRYYHPHYKDSKDPRARLCRQLSTEYTNKFGLNDAAHLQQDVDVLSTATAAGAVLTVISAITPHVPAFIPAIFCAASLVAAVGAYHFHSDLEEDRKKREAHIKNGLFAANQNHKPYDGPMTRSRRKAEEQSLEPPRLGYR